MSHRIKRLFRAYKQEIFIMLIAFVVAIVAVPIFTYFYFARDLTSKENIMNRNNTGVILLDRNNKPFFSFYQARPKRIVPLQEINEITQQAIISAEDRDFYDHPGFSLSAILRSLYLDIVTRDIAYGGSTITQQLVKNALLTPTKSFLRKYQEIVLAQEIERRYNKKEILEMYLNSVYFGEGAFGIQQAAETYFGKDAKALTLAESSLLAAILPSPSRLSPITGDFEAAKKRQDVVLQRMVEDKYITPLQLETALASQHTFEGKDDELNSIAPHFALLVKQQLEEKYGEERISRSGFKVKTSLDLSFQTYAEEVVATQVERLRGNDVSNGAAVAIDPKSGEVVMLVGSKDWFDEEFGKVNIVTSRRPPGSSMKPIVYAAALEKRILTPGTVLRDEPTTFQRNYRPQNYDRRFRGKLLPRRALANSLNVPAVQVQEMIGIPSTLDFAERLGITGLKSPSDYGLSFILGTAEVRLLDMTAAFATFASQGLYNSPTTILEITDKRGKSIYQHHSEDKRVLEAEVAFIISNILSDNTARAEVFGSALTLSRPAAVKTGTTESYRDSWTVGYTPSLSVGVWVGNNDNTPMDQIAGSLGAAPIWRLLMERRLRNTLVEQFRQPLGVAEIAICRENGLKLRDSLATSSAQKEFFITGTEPRRYCDFRQVPIQQPTQSGDPTSPTPTPATTTPTPTPIPTISSPQEEDDPVDIQITINP